MKNILIIAAFLIPITVAFSPMLRNVLQAESDPICGFWFGAVDDVALGADEPPPKLNAGNAVLKVTLRRTFMTTLKRYSGTGTLVLDGNTHEDFKVLDVSVSPTGSFNGFMVGSGATSNSGGEFSGRLKDGHLILLPSTHTTTAKVQGILKRGSESDFKDMVRQLSAPLQ